MLSGLNEQGLLFFRNYIESSTLIIDRVKFILDGQSVKLLKTLPEAGPKIIAYKDLIIAAGMSLGANDNYFVTDREMHILDKDLNSVQNPKYIDWNLTHSTLLVLGDTMFGGLDYFFEVSIPDFEISMHLDFNMSMGIVSVAECQVEGYILFSMRLKRPKEYK